MFTEGADPRILEAASRLLASSFLHPILVGNEEEVYKTLFFNAIIGCDEVREAFITTIIKNY